MAFHMWTWANAQRYCQKHGHLSESHRWHFSQPQLNSNTKLVFSAAFLANKAVDNFENPFKLIFQNLALFVSPSVKTNL